MRVGCLKNIVFEIKVGYVLLGGDVVFYVNFCCLYFLRVFLERAFGFVI